MYTFAAAETDLLLQTCILPRPLTILLLESFARVGRSFAATLTAAVVVVLVFFSVAKLVIGFQLQKRHVVSIPYVCFVCLLVGWLVRSLVFAAENICPWGKKKKTDVVLSLRMESFVAKLTASFVAVYP